MRKLRTQRLDRRTHSGGCKLLALVCLNSASCTCCCESESQRAVARVLGQHKFNLLNPAKYKTLRQLAERDPARPIQELAHGSRHCCRAARGAAGKLGGNVYVTRWPRHGRLLQARAPGPAAPGRPRRSRPAPAASSSARRSARRGGCAPRAPAITFEAES